MAGDPFRTPNPLWNCAVPKPVIVPLESKIKRENAFGNVYWRKKKKTVVVVQFLIAFGESIKLKTEID